MIWARLGLPLLVILPLAGAAMAFAGLQQAVAGDVRFASDAPGPNSAARFLALAADAGLETHSLVTGPEWLRRVAEPERTVYVAVGVERAYTRAELDALREFASRGGHWLVADTGPATNPLVDLLDVDVSDRPLRDPLEVDGWVPLNASLAGRAYSVHARQPSALILSPKAQAEVLAASGPDSFLDVDTDANANRKDYPGPLPVVAVLRDVDGTRHLVSADVGLFLDARPAQANDNEGFVLGAARLLLPDGGTLLYDDARHALPSAERGLYAALQVLDDAGPDAPHFLPLLGIAAAGLILAMLRRAEAPWTAHRFEPQSAPFPRVHDGATPLARRAALALLGRKAGLPAHDLAEVPTPQLLALTKHDPDVAALLEGHATADVWHRIETRLERLA